MHKAIEDKKPIYIMSLEASDIYYHNNRNMELQREYYGMIPFSLESIKLLNNGLSTKYIENRDKYISNDIVNVKFKTKVKNADDMIDMIEQKLEYVKNEKYEEKLLSFKGVLEEHSSKSESEDDYWDEISVENLRKELYSNGFSITFVNQKSGKQKVIEYVVYKRSSAKSRTGQCLFIKKELYKKMIKWSRMSLPFRKDKNIDLASLLAYESLVGSSLEDTITINPKNILIVDDVESKFIHKANVVRKNETTGFLDSFAENTEITNSLFDGESLLDSQYFKDGHGMILLRNHMFKSASFNCNVQQFLKDNCPKDIDFEEWKIENMFEQEMYAKDIHMIITPSSVKALKFSDVLGSQKEMWNHWKSKVEEDGNLFGICKHEKQSKIGFDEDGQVLQQTSYQMINCLPASYEDVDELATREKEYISRLKTDNDFLMEEIYNNRDITNSNEALYGIYQVNKDIVNTKIFKKFKSKFIHNKVNYSKKGKIKLLGDYCVLLGNPMELLHHSIKNFKLNVSKIELEWNEVYCKLYEYDKKLIGFRNPNTSPSNVLIMNNKYSLNIDKYFNLTNNIIVVNAINFPIQDILSGCDYDSDTILVSSEPKLIELGEKCFGHYLPCVNNIKGDSKKYKLNNNDHFEIDNQLSHSQRLIGRVVNLGQYSMSVYWDLINKGENNENIKELLKKVDVMTVLSGIAIDMAKKFYDIDMQSEIKYVSDNENLKNRSNKPNFWIYVSQNKSTKNKVEHYNCPMDYLIKSLSNISYSDYEGNIDFYDLINDFSTKKADIRQVNNVEKLMSDYESNIKTIMSSKDENTREKLKELEAKVSSKLKIWKLKADTIAIILKKHELLKDEFLLKTLKLLYENHTEEFKKVIKSVKNSDF